MELRIMMQGNYEKQGEQLADILQKVSEANEPSVAINILVNEEDIKEGVKVKYCRGCQKWHLVFGADTPLHFMFDFDSLSPFVLKLLEAFLSIAEDLQKHEEDSPAHDNDMPDWLKRLIEGAK